MGVSEIYKLVMEADLQIDLGHGKSERSQKTSLGKILSSLRDRQIGGYRVVFGGSKNGAKLWKLIGQEVTEILNEHHEHILAEGKNDQDVYSNISDIIQYNCDLSNINENIIA